MEASNALKGNTVRESSYMFYASAAPSLSPESLRTTNSQLSIFVKTDRHIRNLNSSQNLGLFQFEFFNVWRKNKCEG